MWLRQKSVWNLIFGWLKYFLNEKSTSKVWHLIAPYFLNLSIVYRFRFWTNYIFNSHWRQIDQNNYTSHMNASEIGHPWQLLDWWPLLMSLDKLHLKKFKWINEQRNQETKEQRNKGTNERRNNEWKNKRTKERRNEGTKERRNEGTKERRNEETN